jgi:hypothetical protein
MSELLVFVSSIMDRRREDLFPERDAAKEATQSLGLTTPWRFEDSPASSLRVDYSYLNKVAEADLFLLLLGRELTGPVRMEYDAALGGGKPVLVFLKQVERTPEAERFVGQIPVKWKSFDGIEALRREIRAALAEELINAHRQARVKLPAADLEKLQAEAVAPAVQAGSGVAVGQQRGGVNLGAGAQVQGHAAGRDVRITENRRAGRDFFEARDHGVIAVNTGGETAEIMTLLDNLAEALAELKLPAIDEKRVHHALAGAKLEAEAPTVDRKALATRLLEAAEVVKSAGTVVLEATAFGRLLQQGLAWAGPAISGLLR